MTKHFITVDKSRNDFTSAFKQLTDSLKNAKDTFLFFFMDGCGPCERTKESWAKLEKMLPSTMLMGGGITVAMVNQVLFPSLVGVGETPIGFPTLRHVKAKGKGTVEYEDSGVSDSQRSSESLVKWIQNGIKSQSGGTKKNTTLRKKVPSDATEKCKRTFCDKIYVPRQVKQGDELAKSLFKLRQKRQTNAQKKLLKSWLSPSNRKTQKAQIVEQCEKFYCNQDCSDTIFEAGKGISKSLKKKYSSKSKFDKLMLMSLQEQRTKLFKGKQNVLVDGFSPQLKRGVRTRLKKQGAISGCTVAYWDGK